MPKNMEKGTSSMIFSNLPPVVLLTGLVCTTLLISVLILCAIFKPQAIEVLIRLLDALYDLRYGTNKQRQKRKKSAKKLQQVMKKG
jgi:hypothetical protein